MNEKEIIKEYLKLSEIALHNANFIYSLPALANILAGEAFKNYMLEEILTEEEARMHKEGWWYQHQLALLSPYCLGYSAKDISIYGISSTSNVTPKSRPAKRLKTFLDQCSNFICLMAQELSGAVALNDIITIATSYVWYEENLKGRKYSDEDLYHAFQSFLYNVNLPFRSGNSPFTNVTLEFGRPAYHLKDDFITIDGEVLDKTYSEIPSDYYNRTILGFLRAMWEGDAEGRPWTFPLITVQITDDFDFENSIFKQFLDNLDKHGGAYFENFMSKPFIEAGLEPRDPALQRSFCCRFQIDIKDILKVSNLRSIFGNVSGVGSTGVISINFNRLGYINRGNKEQLFEHLKDILSKARNVLNKKRKFIEEHKRLYPTFFYYIKDLSTMFNTISLQGGHEGLINFGFVKYDETGKMIEEDSGIFHTEGINFAKEVADFILKTLDEFMKEDGIPWNFEYAPGETAAPVLAQKDLEFYNTIKSDDNSKFLLYKDYQKIHDFPPFVKGSLEGSGVYLTSGFQPPFDGSSLAKQIDVSAKTQRFATGGSIQHIFLNEKTEGDVLARFIKNLFSKKTIIYITITPTLTICNNCGRKIVGERYLCPYCGSEDTTIYSRVIGYYRPIARKVIKAEKDKYLFEGQENYWQGGRRADWITRKKVLEPELLEIMQWLE
jgi:anaerobic ribonucleoside-triphosphate reductase